LKHHGFLYNRLKKHPCRLCGLEFSNSHLLKHMEEHKKKGEFVGFGAPGNRDKEKGRAQVENVEGAVVEEPAVPCASRDGQDILESNIIARNP
jgi:hypothetical protein